MDRCPWCGRRVEQLYPVPPEVVTRGLVDRAGGADQIAALEGCAECISAFMEGELVA